MTVLKPSDAEIQAQLRALHATMDASPSDDPTSAVLTSLMRHGGLYTLLDTDVTTGRVLGIVNARAKRADATPDEVAGSATISPDEVGAFVANVQGRMINFFTHLVPTPTPCRIPVGLMSHLSYPHEGVLFIPARSERKRPEDFESPDVPAIFTFVGQFVDHDLTMNAVNLVDPQSDVVASGASPFIDLDSVYGPRTTLASAPTDVFDGDRFALADRDGVIDLPRSTRASDQNRPAVISDARNDENQLVLQVHLLVERLHNTFVDAGCDFAEARRRTVLNWQSVLLHDYLPRILRSDVLSDVLTDLEAEPFGNLRYKPWKSLQTGNYAVAMPHEFAIGFRIGHSQLRLRYRLNNGAHQPVPLFDGSLGTADLPPAGFEDLRGSQDLSAGHRIDWNVFLLGGTPVKSNAIDSHVTSAIFDLPESSIPDDSKFVGNLAHRNLIRSREIGLCSGEDLAVFYGLSPLSPAQIEPRASKRHLFEEGGSFSTPLWFYLLREAELEGSGGATLGPACSRLIAEVIAGGVRYASLNWWDHRADAAVWSVRSAQPNPERVALADLISFVGA